MAKKSRTADKPTPPPETGAAPVPPVPAPGEDEGATAVLPALAAQPDVAPPTPADPPEADQAAVMMAAIPAPAPKSDAAPKSDVAAKPAPAAKNVPAPKASQSLPTANIKPADNEPREALTGVLGLDVRMLWQGDTHAARFFARPTTITLGAEGTFALPPEAMGKSSDTETLLLVEPHATAGFALRVDNTSASGHVLVDGQSHELSAIRAGSSSLKGPSIPLTANTHAYVTFGSFTFLISRAAVPPPPRAELWSRENTIFSLCLLLALLLLGGPLFAGFNSAEFRNRAKLSYLEQVEQDLRKPETIEVLIQEEPKEEVKPEEAKAEDKPSEAAPLQAPEVKPEEKKADNVKKELDALNEEDRKQKVTDLVKDELAKNTGAIDDALKDVGGPTTKLFAEDDSAGGPAAGTTLGADTSDRAADALGGGGRRGGPGDGSETGRQVASGLGKEAGVGLKDPKLNVHEKAQSLVRVGGSVGDATGELPKAVIKAYIATKMGAIKACYQKGLQTNPDLSGKIKVKFLIQPNGAVNPAKVEDSSIGNDGVENCVLNNVKAWKFPQAKGGGVTTVVYPFVFASH